MDITEDPEFTIVSRWKEAMPQYTVGHNERMKQLTTFMEKELPGIYWQVAPMLALDFQTVLIKVKKRKACIISFGESNRC